MTSFVNALRSWLAPSVQRLTLFNYPGSLSDLGDLRRLRELQLSLVSSRRDTAQHAASDLLAPLPGLSPGLTRLELSGPGVLSADLAHVGRATSLRSLHVGGLEAWVAQDLAALSGLVHLRTLSLETSSQILPDDALSFLSQLHRLTDLTVQFHLEGPAELLPVQPSAFLCHCPQVRALYLRLHDLASDTLVHLTALERLSLVPSLFHESPVASAPLEGLGQLAGTLTALQLFSRNDRVLEAVGELSRLRVLSLQGLEVRARGHLLSSLAQLEDLQLHGVWLTDGLASALGHMHQLRQLELDPSCSNCLRRVCLLASLQPLAPSLRSLSLRAGHLVDDDNAHLLAHLTRLTSLELPNALVRLSSLRHVRGLTGLRRLDLSLQASPSRQDSLRPYTFECGKCTPEEPCPPLSPSSYPIAIFARTGEEEMPLLQLSKLQAVDLGGRQCSSQVVQALKDMPLVRSIKAK